MFARNVRANSGTRQCLTSRVHNGSVTEPSADRATPDEVRVERMRSFELAAHRWASAQSAIPSSDGIARAAVLVEGASDRAALLTLAEGEGRDLAGDGVAVLAMGGAMSIRRYVAVLGPRGLGLSLHGLCDIGEVRFFEKAGMRADDFEVCDPDLEGELIRALGIAAVEQVLADQGDLRLFRTFQRQPAQRERTAEQQLHRFLGTTSGRKEQYGRELATAAEAADAVPAPLRRLLDAV